MKPTRRLVAGAALGAATGLASVSALAQTAPFTGFGFPATGAPTNRTMPDRLKDVYNVKDFGAKGDGITPDGAAIQLCIDTATAPGDYPGSGNVEIYFPNGTYLVDQQLFLHRVFGLSMLGAGKHQTILKYTGSATNRPAAAFNGTIYASPDLLLCNTVPSPPINVGDTITGAGVPGGTTTLAGGPFVWVLNTQGTAVPNETLTSSGGATFSGQIQQFLNLQGSPTDVLNTTSAITGDFISYNQIISGSGVPANTVITNGFGGVGPSLWLLSTSGTSLSNRALTSSAGFTALMTAELCQSANIRGMTFDVTGSNANIAYQLYGYAGFPGDNGTRFQYDDVAFVGATVDAFICALDGASLGSEQLFIGCSFINSGRGIIVGDANALNYTFISCNFEGCGIGSYAPTGSLSVYIGCYFNNPGFAEFTGSITGTSPNGTLTVSTVSVGALAANQILFTLNGAFGPGSFIISGSGTTWSVSTGGNGTLQSYASGAVDVLVRQADSVIMIGCWSESSFVLQSSPCWIVGCYHNPPVQGGIWAGGVDVQWGLVEACLLGANSTIWGSDNQKIYLLGDSFSNTGYLTTNFSGYTGAAALQDI